MSYIPPVLQVLLALLTAVAGATDIRTRRIPNWLVLVGLVLGFGMNWFLFGSVGLTQSAKGLGLALLIYFPLFALRAMGAGDAKLMGAVGAIVGPGNWFGIFLATAVLGGVVGLLVVLVRKRFSHTVFNVAFIVRELMAFRPPYLKREDLQTGSEQAISLPHGSIIACASVLFLIAVNLWAPR